MTEIEARSVLVAQEWLRTQQEFPGAKSIWPAVLGLVVLFLCSAAPFILAMWVKP